MLSASRPCRLTSAKDPPPVRIQREFQRASHTVSKKKIHCPCQELRPRPRKRTKRVFIGPGTGWTVQGSNPGGSDTFRTCPDRSRGRKQPPIQGVPGFFLGGKAAGAWRWPPTPSSAKVKERVAIPVLSLQLFTACSKLNFYIVMTATRRTSRQGTACTRRNGTPHVVRSVIIRFLQLCRNS